MADYVGLRWKTGLVEVGKEMRRRHDPSFFKGKGAMPETEAEAFCIFREQFVKAYEEGAEFIFIDGQPRMASQVNSCIPYARKYSSDVYLMFVHVEDEEAAERAVARDSYSPAALDLSMKRLKNDKIQLFDVLGACICRTDVSIIGVDSNMSPRSLCFEIPKLRAALC